VAGGFPVILDTCALLWLASGERKISRQTLKRIEATPAVYVSAISGFEIALKAAKGRLTLPVPPSEWFPAILEHHGLRVLPLDLDTCLAAAALPPIHFDPCDRFIIATALRNEFPVVTADEHFEKYGLTVLV
jgi:PIN domain nuclease of toxin-antitoxin system